MFTQPIAMRCTEKQFLNIQKELQTLGYTFGSIRDDWDAYAYLVNNSYDRLGDVSNALNPTNNNRIVFEEWDKELFLAIAAMTNQVNGIAGEWWKSLSTDCSGEQFIAGNIYKSNNPLIYAMPLFDERGNKNGLHRDRLIKATVDDIVNHFKKQTITMKKFEVTREQLLELHTIACQTWKTRIEIIGNRLGTFGASMNISYDQVKEIFDAATTTQLPTVQKIFPDFNKTSSYDEIAKELFKVRSLSLNNIERENVISTSKEQLESILALNKLCNVAKYLNEGWLPDFADGKTNKWRIYINYGKLETSNNQTVSEGTVYFKSSDLARKAIEILGEEEIKKALTLNH